MRDYAETVARLRLNEKLFNERDAINIATLYRDAADAIEELLFERDRYKSFFDRIKDLPDCNICLKKNGCEFVPRPGEHTRINCAFCLTAPPKEG